MNITAGIPINLVIEEWHTYSSSGERARKGHVGSPKGGSERTITMSPELEDALRIYRARVAEKALRTGARWIYPRRNGKPVRDNWIRARFRKCIEEAGFPATGKFHTLRHSYGSHSFERNIPATIIRDTLGHADFTTTNQYPHSVSNAQEIAGRIDRVRKPANPRKQEEGPGEKVLET